MGHCFGYKIAALSAAYAMQEALAALRAGHHPERLVGFAALRDMVGFPAYYEAEQKYAFND